MNTTYTAEMEQNIEMMNNENPVQEYVSDEVYNFVADRMVNEASWKENIKAHIMDRWGLSAETAERVICEMEEALAEVKSEENSKDAGTYNMIFGALWFIGGVTVTAVTYAAASGGGTYIVAFGAIIGGAIQFFKGVAQKFA